MPQNHYYSRILIQQATREHYLNHRKSQEITGNHRKSQESTKSTGKHRNTKEIKIITGINHKLREITEITRNHRSWEITGNHKNTEITRNHQKSRNPEIGSEAWIQNIQQFAKATPGSKIQKRKRALSEEKV